VVADPLLRLVESQCAPGSAARTPARPTESASDQRQRMVPPSYFFDEDAARRIDAQLELLAAMRDAAVRQIALRAADLSPESLRSLADLIERWRQLEGLPNGEAGDNRPAAQTGERGDQ
jgi:hypothetical protein